VVFKVKKIFQLAPQSLARQGDKILFLSQNRLAGDQARPQKIADNALRRKELEKVTEVFSVTPLAPRRAPRSGRGRGEGFLARFHLWMDAI
jgi:hypothetical protein